jgi:ATPases with chaperone activity, ATP-binding subunit
MRFEKFTNRLQQALSDAQSLAMGKDHTAIEGIHILSTLLEEPSNQNLLQQAGANLPELKTKLQQALQDTATIATPTGDINLNPEAVKALNLADSFAQKAGDEFLSTDWVILGLAETGKTKTLLNSVGVTTDKLRSAIEQIRGGEQVMSNNHEDQRDSLNKYTLDLNARALEGKLDPVLVVTKRFAVPFRFYHAVVKTTPY